MALAGVVDAVGLQKFSAIRIFGAVNGRYVSGPWWIAPNAASWPVTDAAINIDHARSLSQATLGNFCNLEEG